MVYFGYGLSGLIGLTWTKRKVRLGMHCKIKVVSVVKGVKEGISGQENI